jgi:hypothetical protein
MSDYNSYLLLDQEVVELISKYLILFENNFSIDLTIDRHKLDHMFMYYFKNNMLTYINCIQIVGLYSKEEKIKLETFESFYKLLLKTSDYFPVIIYDNFGKDFNMMLIQK